jgi:hypothetical protein
MPSWERGGSHTENVLGDFLEQGPGTDFPPMPSRDQAKTSQFAIQKMKVYSS